MPQSKSNTDKGAERSPDGKPFDGLAATPEEALISLDPAGNIIAWNAAACRLFGFTAEEVMGKPVIELLCPPHLRAAAGESLHKVARGQGPFHFETQRQKKDGSLIDVSVTIIALRNRAGKPISIWVTYRDISDHKHARAELEARADREQAVAALGQHALAALELVAVLDAAVSTIAATLAVDYCGVLQPQPDGGTLLLRAGVGWHPGTVGHAIVGSGPDSLAGYTLLSKEPVIVDDLYAETRFQAPQLLLDHEVKSGLSVIIGDPEQPYGVLGAYSRSSRKFDGRDAGFLQAVANIIAQTAKRLAAQEDSRRTETYFRSLIDNSFDVMVVLDPQGSIRFDNAAMRRRFGYEPGELAGQIGFDFVHPQEVEGARRALATALREGAASLECRLRRKDGAWLVCELALSRISDPAGQPVAVVSIRDLTGHKRAEQTEAFLERSPSEETRLETELQQARGVFAVARDVTRQKALEQQLRQAQAYTRGLIESSVDGMLTVDSNLVITDVNERMAALVETPKTMLIGSRFDRLFTDPERAALAVRQALKEGSVFNYDLTLRTLSGQEILVSFNASIFHDAAGQILGVFGVVRDVTEQRGLDQQLRAQQIYSRSLIESSIDALLTVDPQLNITDVNEQTVSLTGYSRPELLGSTFPTLFTDPERAAQGVRQALAEGFVRDYELTLRSAAGAERLVSVNVSPFKDAQGKVLGILASARDVSERQRLERERSLLASIVTSSPDAIYSYAPDTTVITWNAGAERLLGYSAAEMIGRSMTVCVPLERRGELLARESLVLHGKGVQQFETQRRRKDGSLVDVSMTTSAITDKQGNVRAVASICRDIAERKRFELELTKARDEALEGARVRSEFLANMSHEIRTPLNSIIGMTDMLLDTGLTAEQRRRASNVKGNAASLLTILNDILNFSKLSAGKVSFETVDFDLEETFHAAVTPFAEAARAKGLEVIASIEPDVPRLLRGDPDRLRQVIANLLSNAVKFTEHGEIVVRVGKLSESPTETMVRFEVRDTGIGIAAEAQPRLFNAFNQVDPSIAIQYGGTGLGLAIARELVERMGGSIGVVSTQGSGSTFWFTVRFAKQSAQVKPPRVATSVAGVRALIVDDREANREILDEQLRSWKMAPDSVASPLEALTIMRREARRGRPYAIALIDLEMPQMDGLELARQIRRVPELTNTALLILSSGGKPSESAEVNAELGLSGFLLKPVRQSELFDTVVHALSSPRAAAPPRPETAQEPRPSAPIEPVTGPHGRPLRVLLAEDNAANREVALWQLEKLGCRPDAVANGRQVLEAVAKSPYDVIVMDCRMPKMDGYEAARQIRQLEGSARHTKIVAMTAHALTGDREKCLAAGMDDYVSKPVTLESLAAALRRVLSEDGGACTPVPDGTDAAPAPALDTATMASLRAKGDLLPNLINTVLGEMPEQLPNRGCIGGRESRRCRDCGAQP